MRLSILRTPRGRVSRAEGAAESCIWWAIIVCLRGVCWREGPCGNTMRRNKIFVALLPLSFFTACLPVAAQAPSAQAPDPLARIHAEAQGNAQACSATGETLCEQVAPKIIANAQGESPLAENLHRYASEMD